MLPRRCHDPPARSRAPPGGRANPPISCPLAFDEPADGWIVARVLEVPGAFSQGRTREEARANALDALQTVLTPDAELAGQPRASRLRRSDCTDWQFGPRQVDPVAARGSSCVPIMRTTTCRRPNALLPPVVAKG